MRPARRPHPNGQSLDTVGIRLTALVAKPKGPDFSKNLMFYGDNLGVMRQWLPDESVDLIYLDPPFNSDRSYNVLFRQQSGQEGRAQIKAFDDFWKWSSEDEVLLSELISTGPDRVPEVMAALDGLVGRTDMMSYLVNMAIRSSRCGAS